MLIDPAGEQRILLPPAAIRLWPRALRAESATLLAALQQEVQFTQHRVRIFGRELPAPRLSAWYGDAGCDYRYSGVSYAPQPLGPVLQSLRARVEAACGHRFNSVLLNLYRDGSDAMGWHSDDEPELGPAPLIASISLGAPRRFLLRSRALPRQRHAMELPDGSLLLM
ncbi:MAG: alpha-ketoglutarate-dependent dioxygenase AlkB family protein, partial [Gammaproteobacteria bacterium]